MIFKILRLAGPGLTLLRNPGTDLGPESVQSAGGPVGPYQYRNPSRGRTPHRQSVSLVSVPLNVGSSRVPRPFHTEPTVGLVGAWGASRTRHIGDPHQPGQPLTPSIHPVAWPKTSGPYSPHHRIPDSSPGQYEGHQQAVDPLVA